MKKRIEGIPKDETHLSCRTNRGAAVTPFLNLHRARTHGSTRKKTRRGRSRFRFLNKADSGQQRGHQTITDNNKTDGRGKVLLLQEDESRVITDPTMCLCRRCDLVGRNRNARCP
uniref:(northern house mosquito) hypothetical protein n=1 Tax=Culex pipiens TaxID=7175 RepID=A0A8D8F267_CULPI